MSSTIQMKINNISILITALFITKYLTNTIKTAAICQIHVEHYSFYCLIGSEVKISILWIAGPGQQHAYPQIIHNKIPNCMGLCVNPSLHLHVCALDSYLSWFRNSSMLSSQTEQSATVQPSGQGNPQLIRLVSLHGSQVFNLRIHWMYYRFSLRVAPISSSDSISWHERSWTDWDQTRNFYAWNVSI